MAFIPRELRGIRRIGYTSGNFGLNLSNLLISVFAFQFYVYTVNLDSLLVSIGISMNLIIGAIFSIVFGVVADNKKPGMFGKRRPLLIYGLPIWLMTCIAIWTPPWYCPENNSMFWPTAFYFWIVLGINSISGALLLSAHSSMLPEQSQTSENRKRVASSITFFVITASIISMMIPLIVESILEDPENVKWWQPSGTVLLFYMPIIAIGFAVFALISVLFTFFSVDESFHKRASRKITKTKSLKATFQQMLVPTKDKNYSKYLGATLFNSVAGKILGVLIIPFLTYVLKFRDSDFFIYIVVSIFCKYAWYYAWRLILNKSGLKRTYMICMTTSALVSFLELIFLFEILNFEIKIVLFIITIGTLLGSVYIFRLFSTPMAAALVHEAALVNDKSNIDIAISNLSGAYFGSQQFMMSIGQSIASLMLGIILTGSNERDAFIITISFASMGIFYLLAVFYLKQVKLKQDSQ